MPNTYEVAKANLERRWRWWYSSIADWMIANPGRPLKDMCQCNGGPIDASVVYVRMIAASDLFKAHYEKRKGEWRERHDDAILAKTLDLADLTTDLMVETLKSKRTQVPIETLQEIRADALNRLGFAPNAAPTVQITQTDNRVQVAVSAGALEEARDAIRAVEDMRRRQPRLMSPPQVVEVEQEDTEVNPEDRVNAPLALTS